MKIRLAPGPHEDCVTFGKNFTKSSNVVTFSCSSVLELSTCIVMGTSCRFSERFCAVTITSVSAPPAAVASA